MVRKNQKRIILTLIAVLLPLWSSARTDSQNDSLVRLLKASSLEQTTIFDQTVRKTKDATFLHNGTYLICDSALWYMDRNLIEARGNVKLEQGGTRLTSDELYYYSERNVAEFRGPLVQLVDKDGNTLRTRNLDYNTKDSLATFFNGAAMKDKDGQIMESLNGSFYNARNLFQFRDRVEMYTDSIQVKTESMDYDTGSSTAYFNSPIDFWKEDNMLSAGSGWYDRSGELFFFSPDVHATTRDQEVWCDSLFFWRIPQNVKMLNSVQVQDTTRNTFALADYMFYDDSLSRITMRRKAGVAIRTEQNDKVDTLYFGADTLVYRTLRRCDVDSLLVRDAAGRLSDMMVDPVKEYRTAAAAKAASERKEKEQFANIRKRSRDKEPEIRENVEEKDASASAAETEDAGTEDKETPEQEDGEVMEAAPAPAPADTTDTGFLYANGNVKVYRTDLQVACDSLVYCDLDSIARLFKSPVVWNEGVRQYSSDSIYVLVRNGGLDRANLISNAFIVIKEDEAVFDQIKSSEVMAYFDEASNLSRFDALGGASAIFYIQEDSVFATVNKVESKILSGLFSEGELSTVHYFDAPKNNAYPLAQLKPTDRELKGFNWSTESRPAGREDITDLKVRASERGDYALREHPQFRYTDMYFNGYMRDLLSGKFKKAEPAAGKTGPADRFAEGNESDQQIVAVDDGPEAADSLAVNVPADSLRAAPADSLLTAPADSLSASAAELSKADIRKAEREKRWAELDERDAGKAARKAEKKLARKRKKTLRLILAMQKQEQRDADRRERYRQRYEKRADKIIVRNGKDTQQIP